MKRAPVVVALVILSACLFSSDTQSVIAATPGPASTPVAAKKKTSTLAMFDLTTLSKNIEFGKLRLYVAPSGLFSLNVPEAWSVTDASTSREIKFYFVDPTANVMILARALRTTDNPDQKLLGKQLSTYVESQFGSQKGFQAADPKWQDVTRSLVMEFNFDVTQNGQPITLFGDALTLKDGFIISTLVFISPKDQYSKIKTQAWAVLQSYKTNSQMVRK